jgi:DNA-binding NarL/FixJ family response regulator
VGKRLDSICLGDPLSPREIDVLVLYARGRSRREMATELGVCDQTIQGYFKDVRRKLGAATRSDAAAIAWERGLIGCVPVERRS